MESIPEIGEQLVIHRLDRTDDGRVMCQLCFHFFTIEQLHKLPDGKPEDVCVTCAKWEKEHPLYVPPLPPADG